VSPATVTVRVLNGSGVAGQASRAASGLRAAGFSVAGYGTAPAPRHGGSRITYGPGQRAAAQAVAGRVIGPVSLAQESSVGSVVVLTTGSGFAGISAANPNARPAPATSAPAQSTVPPWDPTPC
jgi:hypothetical protein